MRCIGFLFTLILSVLACSAPPSNDACEGASVACTCPGGGAGTATCRDGRYAPCVCTSGCTPRTCEPRFSAGRTPAVGATEICGTGPDGCGATLTCAPCPSPLFRNYPLLPTLVQGRLFGLATREAYGGARYPASLVGVDLQNGVILDEVEANPYFRAGTAYTVDPTRRYVSFFAADNSIATLDAVTGAVRRRTTLPVAAGSLFRPYALYELDASAERWIMFAEITTAPLTRRWALWVVERGRLITDIDDVTVSEFIRLANGMLIAIGADVRIANISPTDLQRPSGILVFPQGVTARPALARGTAFSAVRDGARSFSCGGSVCFDTRGFRYDFSGGLDPMKESVFTLNPLLGRPPVAVLADAAADELWFARDNSEQTVLVTEFRRFRLSTARGNDSVDIRRAADFTSTQRFLPDYAFARVAPDTMVIGGVLIRDRRFDTAGR